MNNREQIDTVNQNYIYKDEIIELCSKDLKINKYYFPFMTSKVTHFSDFNVNSLWKI